MGIIEKYQKIIEIAIKIVLLICLMIIASNLGSIKEDLHKLSYRDQAEISGHVKVSISNPVEVQNATGRCEKGFCWKDPILISH